MGSGAMGEGWWVVVVVEEEGSRRKERKIYREIEIGRERWGDGGG